MLARFSLYGFLKNQRYFETFLLLILLEKGFSFLLWGSLIAFREIVVNVLEIPSGAAADVWGKRASMVLSFVAYIFSFLVFGLADAPVPIFGAMLLYAVGDSFRSGTHKALIFAWLEREGRVAEKTRVYGFTRSWSKFGSAVSVVLGAVLVLATDSFDVLFFASVVPYVVGLVNLLSYPRELDPVAERSTTARAIAKHMYETLRSSLRERRQRRLIFESMGFEGAFHATKDFLQPALMALALSSTGLVFESEKARTALFVAPVYFLLFLGAGMASRRAHVLPERVGGERRAAGVLWGVAAVVFAALAASDLAGLVWVTIAAFVALHLLQNLWRPVLVSRFHGVADEESMATVLSIESQAKRVGTMVLAPLCGAAVDAVSSGVDAPVLWPLGAVGLVVAVAFVGTRRSAER